MKKILLSIVAVCAMVASCAKYDEAINDLQKRVEVLEQLTGEVQTLKDLVAGQLFVSSCVEEEGVYTIILSDGTVVSTNAGMTDKPVITVITENGRTYWAYYQGGQVQPLLFNGKKVEVTAVTPSLKFNNEGKLEISVDGGRTWVVSEGKVSPKYSDETIAKENFHKLISVGNKTTTAAKLHRTSPINSAKRFFAHIVPKLPSHHFLLLPPALFLRFLKHIFIRFQNICLPF